MKIDSPCRGCEKRHIGCHQDCKDYIAAKNRFESEKAAIKKKKAIEMAANEFKSECAIRALRRNGKKA